MNDVCQDWQNLKTSSRNYRPKPRIYYALSSTPPPPLSVIKGTHMRVPSDPPPALSAKDQYGSTFFFCYTSLFQHPPPPFSKSPVCKFNTGRPFFFCYEPESLGTRMVSLRSRSGGGGDLKRMTYKLEVHCVWMVTNRHPLKALSNDTKYGICKSRR